MGRKILCEACGSVLNEEILKQKNSLSTCLVCGASLDMEEAETAPEEVDWYYYSLPKAGYYISDEPLDNKEFYHLEYKFKAPKDLEKAKEILRKEYDPTAFATPSASTKPDPIVRCPRCGCTSVQIVPKKWSILTGYRTNSVNRVCVNCKHRF